MSFLMCLAAMLLSTEFVTGCICFAAHVNKQRSSSQKTSVPSNVVIIASVNCQKDLKCCVRTREQLH